MVLPNMEISVPPRLEFSVLGRVISIAAATGPSSYAITKDSLRGALDEGIEEGEILEFLETHSKTGVPENVRRFVLETCGKHGHIKIGLGGCYLHVEDPLILTELKSSKTFKAMVQKDLSGSAAILTEENPNKVARLLRKLGYFPVVEERKVEDFNGAPWR